MHRIPSPNYSPGRLRPARVIILHTAQCPCEAGRARGVMGYLANASVRASAHYCVDPDETVAGVDEQDTAWASPGANADGIQIEQAGYAEFGSGGPIPESNKAARFAYGVTWPDWASPLMRRMIVNQTVPLVADICRRNGFPAKLLEPADLLAGHRGITDHSRITAAYGNGDHWDCGRHFPLAEVVTMVGRLLTGPAPTPSPEGEDDDMPDYLLQHPKGTIVARYPQGSLRAITYHEYVHLTNKNGPNVPVLVTDEKNWEGIQGQIQ